MWTLIFGCQFRNDGLYRLVVDVYLLGGDFNDSKSMFIYFDLIA
ncbi:hypothetical protein [Virgibacillus sp. JSM 102003]